MDNQLVGSAGEEAAVKYLSSRGFVIVQRNFRAPRYGEVDIIAEKAGELVFVEVKTRLTGEYGSPQEAVGAKKLRELRKMVDFYSGTHPGPDSSPRIDVIAVILDTNLKILNIEHFSNITL